MEFNYKGLLTISHPELYLSIIILFLFFFSIPARKMKSHSFYVTYIADQGALHNIIATGFLFPGGVRYQVKLQR